MGMGVLWGCRYSPWPCRWWELGELGDRCQDRVPASPSYEQVFCVEGDPLTFCCHRSGIDRVVKPPCTVIVPEVVVRVVGIDPDCQIPFFSVLLCFHLRVVP